MLGSECEQVNMEIRQKINSRRAKRYAEVWDCSSIGEETKLTDIKNMAISENGDKMRMFRCKKAKNN